MNNDKTPGSAAGIPRAETDAVDAPGVSPAPHQVREATESTIRDQADLAESAPTTGDPGDSHHPIGHLSGKVREYEIKDIVPNRYRDTTRYPLSTAKVEELVESIRSTGFWENLVGRDIGGGQVELAYGRHRRAALEVVYGLEGIVRVSVRPLSDADMLRMMSSENAIAPNRDITVTMEVVRGTVEAYAVDLVSLPRPDKRTKKSDLRYAPSFRLASSTAVAGDSRPFTAATVARLLGLVKPSGEPQEKVRRALSALEVIEEGLATEADFVDCSVSIAQAVIDSARDGTLHSGSDGNAATRPTTGRNPAVGTPAENKCQMPLTVAQAEHVSYRIERRLNTCQTAAEKVIQDIRVMLDQADLNWRSARERIVRELTHLVTQLLECDGLLTEGMDGAWIQQARAPLSLRSLGFGMAALQAAVDGDVEGCAELSQALLNGGTGDCHTVLQGLLAELGIIRLRLRTLDHAGADPERITQQIREVLVMAEDLWTDLNGLVGHLNAAPARDEIEP